MAIELISGSGNNALLTVDAVSNAGRFTMYDSAGNEIVPLLPVDIPVGSVTVVDNDLIGSFDVSAYKFLAIQLTGTWVGTIKFQASEDNGTFFDITGELAGELDAPNVLEMTAPGGVKVATVYNYLRIRVTSYTSGTITGKASAHKEENATGQISSTGQVTIADANGVVAGPMLQDPSLQNHFPVGMIQDVFVSIVNQTTTNLDAAQIFTGVSQSTKGANSIDLSAECDQNLTIQIQQSEQGVSWDHEDVYLLAAGTSTHRNFKALSAFYRVRVINTSASTTTNLHVSTTLTPVSEVLPGALSQAGNLKTAIVEALPAGPNVIGKVIVAADPAAPLSTDFYVTATGPVNNNSRVIRAQACTLKAIVMTNYTATPKHVKIYDTASTPVAGVGAPVIVLSLPAAGTLAYPLPLSGLDFANGLSMTMTLGAANADATPPSTPSDVSLTSIFT